MSQDAPHFAYQHCAHALGQAAPHSQQGVAPQQFQLQIKQLKVARLAAKDALQVEVNLALGALTVLHDGTIRLPLSHSASPRLPRLAPHANGADPAF